MMSPAHSSSFSVPMPVRRGSTRATPKIIDKLDRNNQKTGSIRTVSCGPSARLLLLTNTGHPLEARIFLPFFINCTNNLPSHPHLDASDGEPGNDIRRAGIVKQHHRLDAGAAR